MTPEQFWARVAKSEGCWTWTGYVARHGYGQFRLNGRGRVYAHRLSWELTHGPVPVGLTLDHLCRNTRCVRPDHLEPVPQRVNVLRGESLIARYARRTKCENGHELTPENVDARRGSRDCRECRRARDAMDEWTIDHNPDCDCVLCQARTHARAALVAEAPVESGRR